MRSKATDNHARGDRVSEKLLAGDSSFARLSRVNAAFSRENNREGRVCIARAGPRKNDWTGESRSNGELARCPEYARSRNQAAEAAGEDGEVDESEAPRRDKKGTTPRGGRLVQVRSTARERGEKEKNVHTLVRRNGTHSWRKSEEEEGASQTVEPASQPSS